MCFTKLDNITKAMPPCLQAVQVAALSVQSSTSIVLFHPLTLMVSHTCSSNAEQDSFYVTSMTS